MGIQMMRTLLALLVCVLVCAVSEAAWDMEECSAQAKKATAQCQVQVTKARGLAKKACGGRDPDEVMRKLQHRKQVAARQEEALKRGEAALAKMRARAARLAKMSAEERAKLKAVLAKQKAGHKKLRDAERNAAEKAKHLQNLREQADAATAEAVRIAKESGDTAQVNSAKKKAHDLYIKMVNEKVKIASAHHAVMIALKSLTKLSSAVSKEIGIAKVKAEKEAGALKSVATERQHIAVSKVKEYQAVVSRWSTKTSSAMSIESQFNSNANGAKHELSQSRSTLHSAQKVESAAKRAEGKAGIKISDKPLTMKSAMEQAKRIAAGHEKMPSAHYSSQYHSSQHHSSQHHSSQHHSVHLKHTRTHDASHVHVYVQSHGVSKDVHQRYADKVKALEKQRLAAQAIYQAEKSKLTTLQHQPGASKAAIAKVQSSVRVAQSNVQKLAAAQQQTVQGAVNVVKQQQHHP